MERAAEFLRGTFYLATVDNGNQPRVRPLDSAAIYDGRIYFETTRNKKVFEQLMKNPKIEIFCLNENGYLRLTGEAFLEENEDRRQGIVYAIGKYNDNYGMVAVFSIGNAIAVMTNHSGESETVTF